MEGTESQRFVNNDFFVFYQVRGGVYLNISFL